MSRIIAALCAFACALAVLTVSPSPAHADAPVRILMLGDSQTLGRHQDFTWRYRLDKELRRQGVAFDFVGSRATPYVDAGYSGALYADPYFDQNHIAKAGVWLRDALATIGGDVATQDPDVVVLQVGGADLLYGTSPEDTVARLRAVIGAIRDAKPVVRIIIPEVLTMKRPGDVEINDRFNRYDDMLPGVAAGLSTPESPVSVATTRRGWAPDLTFSVEGVHLSPTGEALYAQRVAEELHAVGLLPGSPSIYHGQVIPWSRTERSRLSSSRGRLNASWDQQVVTSGRVRVRPLGTSAWSTSPFYRDGSWSGAVAGGRSYQVQVQVTRRWLTGPWGSVTQAYVPTAPQTAAPARVTVTPTGVRWAAVAGAQSYVVKFRKVHRRTWVTRQTTARRITASRVKVALVQAVSQTGRSVWSRDVR